MNLQVLTNLITRQNFPVHLVMGVDIGRNLRAVAHSFVANVFKLGMAETKRDRIKQLSSDLALKHGAGKDNHSLGFEYLCLEILAHHPSVHDDLADDDGSTEASLSNFHTGGPNDGGIDGIVFNEDLTDVLILQSKFKSGPIDAATLEEARSFFGRLSEWINPANRVVWNESTRNLLDDSNLSPTQQAIQLFFMTTMTSKEKPLYEGIADDFNQRYQDLGWNVTCHLLTQSDVLQRLEESSNSKSHSLVPSLSFQIAKELQFIFTQGEYRVLVCAIKAQEVGSIYNRAGVRNKLFNLNVRAALLASGKINKALRETAQDPVEAGNFFYYNNGITATCSSFALNGSEVTAENLQVVNGAQTVSALGDAAKSSKSQPNAYVMLRVIETEGGKRKNQIADNITRFQNTQNPVKVSDFFSNEQVLKAIEIDINRKSGHGAFPKIWFEYKRGIKSTGSAGRKKVTLEQLAYLRYACLEDAPFTYRNAKDIWDGANNNKLFWIAMGSDGEQTNQWTEEEIAQSGWMLRCWLNLRDEHRTIKGDNVERNYLGVLARYVTALAFHGMEHLRKEGQFESYLDLMSSEPHCADIEKEMVRVARRILRGEYSKSWEGKVANPRLNLPQSPDTWATLKSELITEYYL